MKIIARPGDLPGNGKVLIFGAGNGGKIVLEALAAHTSTEVLGFVDNGRCGTLRGLPVYAPGEVLPPAAEVTVIVASMFHREIGEQLERLKVADWYSAAPLIANELQSQRVRRRKFRPLAYLGEALAAAACLLIAALARFLPKAVDVGIGPECLINNRYHKKALCEAGYSAETFVNGVTHVTRDFDHVFLPTPGFAGELRTRIALFYLTATRYRALYIYFGGCPFVYSIWLWRLEPMLYALSRTRVVVMPYGQDVQDFTRCPNLRLKHATAMDYPFQNRRRNMLAMRIDQWTRHADHVISGCDWVDYMIHWDTLLPGHFAIDVAEVAQRLAATTVATAKTGATPESQALIRVVHAPNHRTVKGTRHVIAAVEQLRREGVAIELTVVEFAANQTVLERIAAADIVVDQLVIGWYAMVAIEAMTMGKPVVCYIRPDLRELYEVAGQLEPGELPLLPANPDTLVNVLRELAADPAARAAAGRRGADFVVRHHSIDRMSGVFSAINKSIGLFPRTTPK